MRESRMQKANDFDSTGLYLLPIPNICMSSSKRATDTLENTLFNERVMQRSLAGKN